MYIFHRPVIHNLVKQKTMQWFLLKSSNVVLEPYVMFVSLRFYVCNNFSDFKSVVSVLCFPNEDFSQFSGQIY